MTRLIDADELKKCAIPCEIHNGALTDLCVPLYQIDNAPTVEPDMDFAKECYANGYEDGKNERPQGDLISREALKEHKFLSPQVKVIGGRHCGKIREQIIEAYQKGWNDCIDAIIDNAPTVFDDKAYSDGYTQGTCDCEHAHERQKGEWKINLTTGDIFCSCCKEVRRDTRIKHINFCNSCGADMRGDKNGKS